MTGSWQVSPSGYVVVLSGPERARARAELALEAAGLLFLPADHYAVRRKSFRAEDWDFPAVPPGQESSEPHGFVAVFAEADAAFHAAYGCVAEHGWVLRVHYHPSPEPDRLAVALGEMLSGMRRGTDALEAAAAAEVN